jgi:hypothetical protein
MTTATRTQVFEAKIIVWDNEGKPNTLVNTMIQVSDPGEARRKAVDLINATHRGHYAYYEVPGWWNQNIRSGWTHGR